MKKILFFLGPPGSGKGTQAKKLAMNLGYRHISTGAIIRNIISDPKASKEDKKIVEDADLAGRLVPDSFICDIVIRALDKFIKDKENGIIFDGAIRTVNQAENIYSYLNDKKLARKSLVLAIMISDNEARDRLAKRRICSNCNEIYPWVPATKNLVNCSKCGGKLQARPDDKPEIIENRIATQGSAALNPLLDYFRELGMLKIVNGEQSIEDVALEVKKSLS